MDIYYPYYIDILAYAFSIDVLSAEEQEFNQVVLYGKDIEIAQIIAEAKQFPFGAEKRVVIISNTNSNHRLGFCDPDDIIFPTLNILKITKN